MTRISQRFADLKKTGHKGFIAYITAGDPNLKATVEMVLRLEEVGVDVVELGVPFSDPLADGRVNQESAYRALAAGATTEGVLHAIATIREKSEIPILCYSYMNPLMALGMQSFIRRAAKSGMDGLLLLDLPYEEAEDVPDLLDQAKVDHICLVTPTSPEKRIAHIVKRASGFIYCVSREGVTGAQSTFNSAASEIVAKTRRHTDLPVAIGFGISSPQTARDAARQADGVVVGSAIVQRFDGEPHTPAGRKKAAAWVGQLVKAVKEV
ncbi:MAG: tryptophan synthase subunit alpha [Kiritimatiellae bacterium]|nr:tryptophan synthase subunit alpha [Kiritimatiellia bacterium]